MTEEKVVVETEEVTEPSLEEQIAKSAAMKTERAPAEMIMDKER